MVERGLSPEAYTEAGRRSADGLRARGFSDRVVRLAGSIGHDTVPEAEDITEKPELNDEDLAWLAMHSVDEYTSGSDWVDPVEVGDDGVARNDLDRYMGKAKANPRYAVLRDHILTDVDGTPYRGGTEGAYDSQIRVGHRVMEVLTDAIRERNGIGIHPLDLPMYVDNVIKQQILERTDSNAQRQAGEQ